MKIVIADPHAEVRTALRLVLEYEADIEVIGEARSTIELFGQMTNECPHVILLDPDLPGLQISRRGLTHQPLAELILILRKLCPLLRIIALSSLPSAEKDCSLAKADAFFCKSDPPDALLALLQQLQPGMGEKNHKIL